MADRDNRWDDDDWTGEPPEGRYDRSRANPGFWRQAGPPLSITAAGVGVGSRVGTGGIGRLAHETAVATATSRKAGLR